ncbi:MAG: hypothetical protein Kow00106_26690 [Anaerolineae bacterium]
MWAAMRARLERLSGWRGRYTLALALCALALVACDAVSRSSAPTVVPTRTLIPPTATPTPPPVRATPTPTDLPSPATLAAATSEAERLSPVLAMIDLTTRDLTARGIAPDDVRLLSVDGFTWPEDSWGCGATDGAGAVGQRPGYRLVYSASDRFYIYHTDLEGAFTLCDDPAWLTREGAPILVDPIAEEMVALCRADAARRSGLNASAIRLASLVTVIWPDESIGCPQPGIQYGQRETPGFRVVLRAGDEALVYHTSARDVVLCPPDQAILPGLIRQALATPVPQSDE